MSSCGLTTRIHYNNSLSVGTCSLADKCVSVRVPDCHLHARNMKQTNKEKADLETVPTKSMQVKDSNVLIMKRAATVVANK